MERTVLFDLDGTLVDTLPDLAASLNRTLGAAGLAPLDAAAVGAMVGDGMAALLARALAARDRAPDLALLARFQADYLAAVAVASRPYPQVAATLGILARCGWRMAVCTNKPEAAARKLLDALGLLSHFAAVGGGDSFRARKPDPAHLIGTLAAAGGRPQQAVMVGDHANDIAAARAAHVFAVFALWGYGPREMGAGAPAAAAITALPALLERLVPAASAPTAKPPGVSRPVQSGRR